MNAGYAPFTDLTLRREEGGLAVSCWGRTYRYENSIFPTSAVTGGRELLSAPMTLRARFGQREGVFTRWEYTVIEETPERIRVLVSAHCENVILNACLTFEMDGLVKTSFRVVPYWSFAPDGENVPRLTELWIEYAMPPARSGLFHYWPNDDTSIIPAGDVVNSGETVSAVYPMKPYIWCGWEEGGLGLCTESAENLTLRDPRACITVRRTPEGTALRWSLLEQMPPAWAGRADRWVDALPPICYTFGVQATPVKPMPEPERRPEVYRRLHIYDVPAAQLETGRLPERIAALGTRYVVLHANWSVCENYGLPREPEAFRRMVSRFHGLGVKVLVYYGYEYSTLMPDWNEKAPAYLIRNAAGHYTGGWQAANLRAYMVCYHSDYARELTENILSVVDEYGLDGIYTDGTYVPWECANESHGCGWRDAAGALHPTFPIFAVRALVQQLYGALHARGCVVETHQSTCCLMPTLSFADTGFDGENIQGALERDLRFLRTDAFRCEYAGWNTGLPMTFIANTTPRMTVEMLAALTLVHGVFPVVRTPEDLTVIARYWSLFDEYDLDGAEFVPYWSGLVPQAGEGVPVSAYRKPGQTVLVCANLSLSPRAVRLSLPQETAEARELVSGAPYPVGAGALAFAAKPFRPYLFLLR